MPKYVGIKNNQVSVFSDKLFSCANTIVIELPEELSKIPPNDLIVNYRLKDGKLISKTQQKNSKDLKVAFISNYGSKCGIGTYSKFLYEKLINHIADYRVFTEINQKYEIENKIIPDDKIVPCWKRGESLSSLINEVKKYSPDVILIQHEFGLFPNVRHWISMLTQLSDYKVVVTMHSVFHHLDKLLAEACIPDIVVHLDGAKRVLKEEKNITGNVHVIPHGCFPCVDKSKLWNFYKSEHTFIQFGFLFKYKGFENSIRAAAILKNKYPDIFFTALCSMSDFSNTEHNLYFKELMLLTEELNLQENVGLIKGFQSETVIDAYLRTNKAAVFPYVSNKEHECFGSSGAAPFTMTKAIPVITSNAHHFEGLPAIKADTPEEIADCLDKLFSNKKMVNSQIETQNKYLENNSWENTAKRYLDIFENK